MAPWPYADDDCEGLAYARNCIYAAYGNVFKRPEWKARFEHEPWYRAKPDFKERDFSPAANANVKALVAASKACMVPPITADDRKLAEQTLSQARMGEVAVEGFEQAWANYAVVDQSKVEYAAAPTPDRKEIAITGLFHAVGPGTFEADASVVLVFDGKGQLVEFR